MVLHKQWHNFRSLLAIFLLLPLCLLAACGAPPPAPEHFSAAATVVYGESTFSAQVRQTAPDALEVAFAAPPELAGLLLSLEGGALRLRCGALTADLPAHALPAAGFAPLLQRALQALAQPRELHFLRVVGGWETKLPLGETDCVLRIAPDGRLLCLTAKKIALQVALSAAAYDKA